MVHGPCLQRVELGGVTVLSDRRLREDHGIVVAFSERSGGASASPYDTLNLAGHVGDETDAVDENRTRLLDALGIGAHRDRLVTAEQIHGEHVEIVGEESAGRGACVSGGPPPVPATDALATTIELLPLLMLYADCVPIVLVVPDEPRGIAVVHAGWRGALARIPERAVHVLARACERQSADMIAYVGPHVGSCCYDIDTKRMSQFSNTFDTIAAAGGRLDLSCAVRESLTGAGVDPENIVEAELCTHDHANRFFSYRAAPLTGRHGAIAAIL